jgi:hypothetical protein
MGLPGRSTRGVLVGLAVLFLGTSGCSGLQDRVEHCVGVGTADVVVTVRSGSLLLFDSNGPNRNGPHWPPPQPVRGDGADPDLREFLGTATAGHGGNNAFIFIEEPWAPTLGEIQTIVDGLSWAGFKEHTVLISPGCQPVRLQHVSSLRPRPEEGAVADLAWRELAVLVGQIGDDFVLGAAVQGAYALSSGGVDYHPGFAYRRIRQAFGAGAVGSSPCASGRDPDRPPQLLLGDARSCLLGAVARATATRASVEQTVSELIEPFGLPEVLDVYVIGEPEAPIEIMLGVMDALTVGRDYSFGLSCIRRPFSLPSLCPWIAGDGAELEELRTRHLQGTVGIVRPCPTPWPGIVH